MDLSGDHDPTDELQAYSSLEDQKESKKESGKQHVELHVQGGVNQIRECSENSERVQTFKASNVDYDNKSSMKQTQYLLSTTKRDDGQDQLKPLTANSGTPLVQGIPLFPNQRAEVTKLSKSKEKDASFAGSADCYQSTPPKGARNQANYVRAIQSSQMPVKPSRAKFEFDRQNQNQNGQELMIVTNKKLINPNPKSERREKREKKFLSERESIVEKS